MNILYIADVPDWAFHKTALALQKYGKNTYEIRFGRKSKYKKCWKELDKFDLVLFPVDTRPDRIIKDHHEVVPRDKLVMMIRCDVFQLCKPRRLAYYESTKLMNRRVKAFMCSNKNLYEIFKKKYDVPCYYAPGGVDANLFRPPVSRKWEGTPRVGWSGSRDFFGKERRGIDLIEEAVKQLGWIWNPAYREDKWRTPEEMVKYYQEEIDIYIDCDRAPGRQNGLLEAGACGLPLVCTTHGIGEELIKNRVALKTIRDISCIKDTLRLVSVNYHQTDYIEKNWSWKHHVKLWEIIFSQIIRESK